MITYHEDGAVFEVEVVEDTSDTEWERYKLKVVKIHQRSPLCPANVGDVFDVDKKKGFCCVGLWYLIGYKE